MTIDSFPIIGIVLALIAALLLAVGNWLQSRAVTARATVASQGLRAGDVMQLLQS